MIQGMAEEKQLTKKEAEAREADLLGSYGLSQDDAKSLIKEIRKHGGLDRFLRYRSQEEKGR